MSLLRILTTATMLFVPAGVAHGAWTVDADGTCVRKWEPSDMLRGPEAMVSAPLQPVRTTAGGAEYAWNKDVWSPWEKVVLGSAVTCVSAAAGTVESLWWIGTGLGDTLTGGYFELTPERALDRTVRPQLSTVVSGSPPPVPAEDPCGRPVAAATK